MLTFASFSQADLDAGKTLFKNYCATCHAKNMKSKLTGPALGGVQERWDSEEDLYAWIRNSQKMIADGHPRATELWEEWKPTVMTSFEKLTDQEIVNILGYIDGVDTGVYPPRPPGGDGPGDPSIKESKSSNSWLYGLLIGVLGLLALILTRIINNLNVISAAKDGKVVAQKTLIQSLTSKAVVSFLIFALIVFAGYTTVTNATNLGRQQGYQPDQPVNFSHVTHAGIHKIECQYCHDGARRSKHSVIPAANTCMNCHKAIKNGSEYGTAELTKIYASIGYDPNTDKYLDNYSEMNDEEYADIFKKWIGDQYVETNELEEIDSEGEELVMEQWGAIVESLTNDHKEKVQGPIEWVRIHNLPDHVYFNHAQHVSVGEVDCQTCHGQVEEMDVVQQHAPLSMGWCINCHRQTGVQFKGNEYYASYQQYHEEIQAGDRSKVTVAEIGGLECQKCHY